MPLQKLGGKEYYIGIFFKVTLYLQKFKILLMKKIFRQTGTKLSSTAGSMTCILQVSTQQRNRNSWRNTSLDLEWEMNISGAAAQTREKREG